MSIAQRTLPATAFQSERFRRKLTSALNTVIRPLGVQVVRNAPTQDAYQPSTRHVPLPEGAATYLHPDNPRLLELTHAYAGHPAARHHLWANQRLTGVRLDLRYFRDDNVYVWQRRGVETDAPYLVSAEYVRKHDQFRLLEVIDEDGLFGVHTFDADGTVVSRDLLDSIIEIDFLSSTLGERAFSAMRVLDIGAGYGRFAHRLLTAFPNRGPVYCTDAVPMSTFLSEYYLSFRGLADKVKVIPLTEVETVLDSTPIDLAVNIHSFSECTFESIEWWLDHLASHQVKHLFIVPNTPERLLSTEPGGVSIDFLPALQQRGYRLAHRSPKYAHSRAAQACGLFPSTYYLFELH